MKEQDMYSGLGKARSGLVFPGERWGTYSKSFDRDEADVKTLGRIAAGISLEVHLDDPASFERSVARFAAAAVPPIEGEDLDIFVAEAAAVLASRQELELVEATQ